MVQLGRPFDLQNWYWFVAGDQTKVYSSKLGDYVPAADATYQTWLTQGGTTTSIASEAELGEVVSSVKRPVPAGILDGYTTSLAKRTIAFTAFKVEFNHENRLRAVERALGLNGSPPNLTAGQALAAVKALM